MTYSASVEKLFDQWALQDGAAPMSEEHWPRVEQILSGVPANAGRYLEIGVGNGYSLKFMAETSFSAGECYGIDISEEMLECSRRKLSGLKNVHLEKANFLDWSPSLNSKFDLIFSMEVFYYFQNIHENIVKAVSLLAPGGEVIVMVDYFTENPDSHHWSEELGLELSLWSMKEYASSFAKAGLRNISQTRLSGGNAVHGVTLCTRGRKGEADYWSSTLKSHAAPL